MAGLLALLCSCTGVRAAETDRVRDLCAKSVAMLGESPLHGFGKTLEFKVELVRRLVGECHFNAFFIESGIYDFLNIQRRLKSGQEVTEPMVARGIGGLWATREVQPLIPLLLEKAKSGNVVPRRTRRSAWEGGLGAAGSPRRFGGPSAGRGEAAMPGDSTAAFRRISRE